jgi:succinate dehydrogenase/fumarate reductase cytochrome b subunit
MLDVLIYPAWARRIKMYVFLGFFLLSISFCYLSNISSSNSWMVHFSTLYRNFCLSFLLFTYVLVYSLFNGLCDLRDTQDTQLYRLTKRILYFFYVCLQIQNLFSVSINIRKKIIKKGNWRNIDFIFIF